MSGIPNVRLTLISNINIFYVKAI